MPFKASREDDQLIVYWGTRTISPAATPARLEIDGFLPPTSIVNQYDSGELMQSYFGPLSGGGYYRGQVWPLANSKIYTFWFARWKSQDTGTWPVVNLINGSTGAVGAITFNRFPPLASTDYLTVDSSTAIFGSVPYASHDFFNIYLRNYFPGYGKINDGNNTWDILLTNPDLDRILASIFGAGAGFKFTDTGTTLEIEATGVIRRKSDGALGNFMRDYNNAMGTYFATSLLP